MAHLRNDRFPREIYNKIKYKKIGPCNILRNIFDNFYEMDFLENLYISLVFNVLDLHEFQEEIKEEEVDTMDEWKEQLLVRQTKEVEEILAKRVGRRTRGKYCFKYLVKWKNRILEDASCIAKEDLRQFQWPSSLKELVIPST